MKTIPVFVKKKSFCVSYFCCIKLYSTIFVNYYQVFYGWIRLFSNIGTESGLRIILIINKTIYDIISGIRPDIKFSLRLNVRPSRFFRAGYPVSVGSIWPNIKYIVWHIGGYSVSGLTYLVHVLVLYHVTIVENRYGKFLYHLGLFQTSTQPALTSTSGTTV